jgi:hypothetical protein
LPGSAAVSDLESALAVDTDGARLDLASRSSHGTV